MFFFGWRGDQTFCRWSVFFVIKILSVFTCQVFCLCVCVSVCARVQYEFSSRKSAMWCLKRRWSHFFLFSNEPTHAHKHMVNNKLRRRNGEEKRRESLKERRKRSRKKTTKRTRQIASISINFDTKITFSTCWLTLCNAQIDLFSVSHFTFRKLHVRLFIMYNLLTLLSAINLIRFN